MDAARPRPNSASPGMDRRALASAIRSAEAFVRANPAAYTLRTAAELSATSPDDIRAGRAFVVFFGPPGLGGAGERSGGRRVGISDSSRQYDGGAVSVSDRESAA